MQKPRKKFSGSDAIVEVPYSVKLDFNKVTKIEVVSKITYSLE